MILPDETATSDDGAEKNGRRFFSAPARHKDWLFTAAGRAVFHAVVAYQASLRESELFLIV